MPFLLRREMRLGSITNQPALTKHTSLQQAAEEALGFLHAAMAGLRPAADGAAAVSLP